MSTVLSFIKRDESGAVDFAATVNYFESELVKHCAERETEQATIAAAVMDAFETYKGLERINMPALVTFTLTRLNAQPENHKILTERVQEYVRDNAQGEVDETTKAQERPNSLFLIGKGKGGGVGLRSRVEAAAAAKAAEKAAAKK